MYPLRRSWLAAALAVALASGAQAQARADRAGAYLRSFHDLRLFNGAALIVDEGEVLFEGAFGPTDLAGGIANSAGTRFRIASLTKQFTAALILRLEEEGLLRVEDPVSHYIGEYPPANGDRITLHQLLTHTSGLPSYTNMPGFMESSAEVPHSPGEILALTWEEPLSFEPGTDFEYSNSGYVLLGWIAERVTGLSYDEALETYVLEPLELGDTGYDHTLAPPTRHAAGHTRDLVGYRPARRIDPSVPYSAGMLYSTVGDLARWADALRYTDQGDAGAAADSLAAGSAGGLFRDSATLRRMMTPDLESYGYGVVVRTREIGNEESVRVIEHSGGIFGFSSHLRIFPDHRRLIVLLDNTSSDLRPIVEGLTSVLWGLEAVAPKPSIAERLLPIIVSGGVEAAMSRFENWHRTRPDDYDYSPRQILMLAGHFREQDPGAAIAILERYVAGTPEAPGIRFALSELHEAAGDPEAAAAHIEAALTYNPGIPELLERLAELDVEPDLALRLPVVALDPEQLAPLTGEYRIDPATTLTVTLEDGVLLAGRTGEEAFRLLPQSPIAFLLHGSAVQLIFDIQDRAASAVSIVEAGQRLTFPRIGG